MKNLLLTIIKVLVKSPLYPHWLWYLKMELGNNYVLKELHGKVIEVGAGDGARKVALTREHKQVSEYIATDYSSWDNEFDEIDQRINKCGFINEVLFGFKERKGLDAICSAMELPYGNESFDYHISFEVLEHIETPDEYFLEASRVLKKGGCAILTVPFLFRMHGGEPDHKLDFFRYLNGYFYKISEKAGLEVVEIYSNTGAGTSIASIFNQYLVRKLYESAVLIKLVGLFSFPLLFVISNLVGYLVDIVPDKRFSTRFHVILRKK